MMPIRPDPNPQQCSYLVLVVLVQTYIFRAFAGQRATNVDGRVIKIFALWRKILQGNAIVRRKKTDLEKP
jgi:hypothetical protein